MRGMDIVDATNHRPGPEAPQTQFGGLIEMNVPSIDGTRSRDIIVKSLCQSTSTSPNRSSSSTTRTRTSCHASLWQRVVEVGLWAPHA